MRSLWCLLLPLALFGCSSSSGPDGGSSDAGSSDGGSSNDERSDGGSADGGQSSALTVVKANDGKTVLLLAPGSVPAGTTVTVKAIASSYDGGLAYELEPSGLVLSPPGLLVTFATGGPDAGAPRLSPTLTGSDGQSERVRYRRVWQQGLSGASEEMTLTEIPHFSQVGYLTVFGGLVIDHHESFRPVQVGSSDTGSLTAYSPATLFDEDELTMTVEGPPGAASIGPVSWAEVSLSIDHGSYVRSCHAESKNTIRMKYGSGGLLSLAEDLEGTVSLVCLDQVWPPLEPPEPPPRAQLQPPDEAQQAAVEPPAVKFEKDLAEMAEKLFGVKPTDTEVAQMIENATGRRKDPRFGINFNIRPLLDLPQRKLPLHVPAPGSIELVWSSVPVRIEGFRLNHDACLEVYPRGTAPASSTNPPIPSLFSMMGRPVSGEGALMPPPRFEFDYVCRCDGVFSLSGSMEWSYPDEASPGFLTPDYNHNASLAGDPGEEGRDTGYAWVGCGDAKGDAIMLSENRRLTRAGTSWSMAAPGVTANVIQAAPAVEGRFGRFSRTTLMYDGVTGFTSNAGPPSFALHTSRQSATATLQSNRYVFSGLTAGAAFDATDTLTVTATPPGGSSTTVTVAAPGAVPTDVNTIIGAPAGGATEVGFPDGTFDELYVFGGLLPKTGAAMGEAGVMRFVKASDMRLDQGSRRAPLFTTAELKAFDRKGYKLGTIYFAFFRTAPSSFFSGGNVPVQAGRMFQVSAADLGL